MNMMIPTPRIVDLEDPAFNPFRALNALLDRLPNLRLDPCKPAPDIRGHQLRVPEHIYVRFDRA